MKFQDRGELLFLLTSVLFLTLLLGFVLSFVPNVVRNVSAVAATDGLGVYWEAECVHKVTYINWGNLTPGSSQEIYVYIRNEHQAPVILLLTASDWVPHAASGYISLSWNYNDHWVNPNTIVKVKFKLAVSRTVQGVTNFNFIISIVSSLTLPGDLNKDGRVDYRDLFRFSRAYGSTLTSPYWNPDADLNGDGFVDSRDLYILRKFYLLY